MSTEPTVFSPTGRIDSSNAPTVERDLVQRMGQGSASVIIDLAAVDYLSSAGLRVLLVAARQAKASGGQSCLVAPRPMVAEVLRMSGFDRIMPIVDSLEAAKARLST